MAADVVADAWVPLAEAAWVVRSVGVVQPDEAVKEATLSVIGDLLGAGMIEVGDVGEAGFTRSPRASGRGRHGTQRAEHASAPCGEHACVRSTRRG